MNTNVKAASNAPKGLSPRRQLIIRFFRSKLSVIGLVVLLTLLLFSFLGPLFSEWGEIEQDYSGGQGSYLQKNFTITDEEGVTHTLYDVTFIENPINEKASPSLKHLLGTDEKGMDILVRLMYGGRISLTIGFIIVFASTLIGVVLGGLAGYFGKKVDMVIMRIVDIFQCIPMLPILLIMSLLISAFMKSAGLPESSRIYFMMIILTVFSWSGTARLVRGQFLQLREQDFMLAAESLGFSNARKIFRHLLPNVFPQLIVGMTLGLGGIILYEATLSFLGLGIQYPYASWGTMIGRIANNSDLLSYPHIWLPPGICIVLAVLAFNFIGDGLRDAFDPKGRR